MMSQEERKNQNKYGNGYLYTIEFTKKKMKLKRFSS